MAITAAALTTKMYLSLNLEVEFSVEEEAEGIEPPVLDVELFLGEKVESWLYFSISYLEFFMHILHNVQYFTTLLSYRIVSNSL